MMPENFMTDRNDDKSQSAYVHYMKTKHMSTYHPIRNLVIPQFNMILVRSIPSHIPTISASATFPSCPYPKEHVEEGGDVPLLQLDLGSDRTRLSGDEFLQIAYRIRRETFDSN